MYYEEKYSICVNIHIFMTQDRKVKISSYKSVSPMPHLKVARQAPEKDSPFIPMPKGPGSSGSGRDKSRLLESFPRSQKSRVGKRLYGIAYSHKLCSLLAL